MKRMQHIGMMTAMLCVALALPMQTHASALFVNVDFNRNPGTSGTYSGLAAAPDPAGGSAIWNGVNITTPNFTSTPNSLVDSSGVVQPGIGFSLSSINVIDTPSQLGYSTTFANALLGDFVYEQNNAYGHDGTFSITGLPNGAKYTLWL